MSSKFARRVGIVAGLALIPTVAFGATANAAPADNQGTTSRPAGEQPAHPDPQRLPHVKARGRQVTFITFGGGKDGEPKEIKFAITPRTVVEQDGHPVPVSELTKGDEVTAEGTYLPLLHLGIAEHVTIN